MWPAGEPSIRTSYITLAAGHSLRVVEAGLAAGPPVLLVHGWGACAYSFAELMPALADAGYRVLAIDLPGFGLSDKPAARDVYTTAAMASVVAEAASRLGLERYSFIGHSMGGAIGLRLALRAKPGVEKLVLLNSVGLGRAPLMGPVRLLTPGFIEPLLPALFRRITIRLILRLAFGTRGRPTSRDIDEYWAPTQFPEMLRACRLLAHVFDFDPLPASTLAAVKVPVLAVGTGRDRMVLGCAERAELIPGARILRVTEGGHLALQECADKVNPAVLRFLAENTA
jgi:pimeloyl-ACP methyl ester carboxylesterase